MTFSIAGAVVSVLVLLPNLLLLAFPPRDAVRPTDAGLLATILERAGQAGCLVLPFLVGGPGGWSWWLVPLGLAIAAYLALWARYLTERRTASLFRPLGHCPLGHRPLGALPIPMAVFPVLAFLSAGGWLASIPVGVAALVLAAGHLPNSWAAWKSVAPQP
ncbi:hypothetical protein [Pseudolysinimonas sp.]|jgi:hypothetical protein|uniref:hypothetical protein n=1 Tax=Pseudolysinimonas sp. TaxID=2680009 RepID=UPI00378402AD